MRWWTAILTVVLLLTGAPAVALAQEATPIPEAEMPEGVSFEVLAQDVVEQIPPGPMEMALVRLTFAPGTSIPIEAEPGLAFIVVESGTFTVQLSVPVRATRVEIAGTPVAAQVSAAQAAFPLNPGESAIIPPLATGEGRNDGTEPVVLLAMFVGPPSEMTSTSEAEATPGMGDVMPAGLTFEPLAFGVIDEWPGGPIGLLIARITIPGGSIVPQIAEAGAEIGYFESGSFTFQTGEGPSVQVVRGLAEMDATGAEPTVEATRPGQGVTANAGDAFFTPPGAVAGGEAAAGADIVALIGVVEPIGEEMATPAP